MGLTKIGGQRRLEVNTIKYFLAQALGSVLLLLAFFALAARLTSPASFLITLSLFLKLGVFPFHAWFISFVSNRNRAELWTVSILQKIIPLWALIKFSPRGRLLLIRVGVGRYIRAAGALTRSRYSLLLGYSSIFNASWIIAALRNIDNLTTVIVCYGVSLGALLAAVSNTISHLSQEIRRASSNWTGRVLITLRLLNLGGMPPFFNFWGKAALLRSISQFSTPCAIVFIIASIMFIYIYVSLLFSQIIFLGSKHLGWDRIRGGSLSGGLIIGLSAMVFIF